MGAQGVAGSERVSLSTVDHVKVLPEAVGSPETQLLVLRSHVPVQGKC